MADWTTSRRRLALAAVAATALGVAACDGDVVTSPADADATGADAEVWTAPPVPTDPDEPGLGAGMDSQFIALRELSFAVQNDDGTMPGFDIDGVDSGPGGALSAAGCGHPDFEGVDGDGGVDNNLATLVPAFELIGIGALEGLIQTAIEDGGLLLLIEMDGVDSLIDDDEVGLRLRIARGKPILGTSGLLLAGQTFWVNPDEDEDLELPGGHIVDGELRAGPFTVRMPIVVFGLQYRISMHDAYLRATFTPDAGIGDGIMGGAVPLSDIRAISDTVGDGIAEAVASLLDGMGDLDPDEGGQCQSMSAAMRLGGVSAFLVDGEPPPDRRGSRPTGDGDGSE